MHELTYRQQKRLPYEFRYQLDLSQYCHSALLETRHIVTEFNDVAKYIVSNIDNFDKKLKYSGWNWHISIKKCNFDNNENSGYPIYIIIDNHMMDKAFAYVERRELNNSKIIIHINEIHIKDKDLESKLNHEFTHIGTSYAKFYMDPLDNRKHLYKIYNLIYYINTKDKISTFLYSPEFEKRDFLY